MKTLRLNDLRAATKIVALTVAGLLLGISQRLDHPA